MTIGELRKVTTMWAKPGHKSCYGTGYYGTVYEREDGKQKPITAETEVIHRVVLCSCASSAMTRFAAALCLLCTPQESQVIAPPIP